MGRRTDEVPRPAGQLDPAFQRGNKAPRGRSDDAVGDESTRAKFEQELRDLLERDTFRFDKVPHRHLPGQQRIVSSARGHHGGVPHAVELSVGSISSPFWMNNNIANIPSKLEAVNDAIGSSILLILQQELAKDHVQASIMDPVNDVIYEQLYFRFLAEARYTQGAASSLYPVENHATAIPAFRSWFPDHVELLGVINVGGGHGWTPTPTPYPTGPPQPGPTPVELPPLEWCFQVKYESFTRARMLKLHSFQGPQPPVIDDCPFNLQFSFTLHADRPIGTVHYWLVFWNENGNNKGFSTRWYSTTINEAGFYSATINREIHGLPFEQTYGKARIKARFVFNLPWDRSEVTTTLYNGVLLDYSGICAVPLNQIMF
mmetsp:Transcript_12530/g.50945  ORF Transcript_12530/g.50945 Transcript_12530/m.50945 type:complete len:374 (-) Transcript_12530:83-1204(-)